MLTARLFRCASCLCPRSPRALRTPATAPRHISLALPSCPPLLPSKGAFTLSALEGKGGRDSPQTLVTTILRADFGGWLSPSSPFFVFGWVRRWLRC